jgi:hypothetical protein
MAMISGVSAAPKTGSIHIVSIPPGAMILLNDTAPYGANPTTPTTVSGLPVGWYYVNLTLEGYKDYSKLVKVTNNTTKEVLAYLQAVPPGTLVVNSIPSGAEIYLLNEQTGIGNWVGFTNKTIKNLPPGLYSVTLLKCGVNTTEVTIKSGKKTTITVNLTCVCPFANTTAAETQALASPSVSTASSLAGPVSPVVTAAPAATNYMSPFRTTITSSYMSPFM